MPSLQNLGASLAALCVLIPLSLAQSPTNAIPTTTGGLTASTAAPACANSCIQSATGTQSCAPGDETCLCSYSTQIQESIYKCLSTSSACNQEDETAAVDYYPAYCKGLNLAIETKVPSLSGAAGGALPAETSTATTATSTSGTVSSDASETSTAASNGKNIHAGLQLPAILGIVLAVLIMIIGVAACLIWSFHRRKQMLRKPRMDLGGEFIEPKTRPPRSKFVNSDFMVQPSPIEKGTFGDNLSRSSTLVPPPPIAKDDKRDSEDKRNSARGRTLKLLLGAEGLRSSFRSSRSASKQNSLMVPPLNINKSQHDELRMSKF